ncbi:hypothetical protein PVAG01_08982 [Phlyctema vagabunda]|uniref:Uncharacterized protein n=1 Tax=Phlyctema vagabunda TaxID=108571 RepID=A0ABR4PAY9_9HELO
MTSQSRPQLPFLYPPQRRPIARFLTTETKTWIKSEVRKGIRYTAYLYAGTILFFIATFGVRQEYLERQFPSASEWSIYTRFQYRDAKWEERSHEESIGSIDWVKVGAAYKRLVLRLEDPSKDGAGLREQEDGGILVAGVGRTGYDVSGKSEPWRRGYHEVLMGAARSAEHLSDWVVDRARDIQFPANTVIGPSNPKPRPLPPGAPVAPQEKDCEPAFDPPEVYYIRILTTQGFTQKQRLDAALAYATWLNYKGTPEAALEMHNWALDIATEQYTSPILDRKSGMLNVVDQPPSTNILAAVTALATHHALHSDVSVSLPIFLSLLRARRSLETPPKSTVSAAVLGAEDQSAFSHALATVKDIVISPEYPPPPSDGTDIPQRTPLEICEEGAVMAHIGEILYASRTSKNSKEEGLAWTREAVDIAENELRAGRIPEEAKKKCRECLQVGLDNWGVMVRKLAKEERELKQAGAKSGSWLGFGNREQKEFLGRWESEEQVIEQRLQRSKEILGVS